MQARLTVEEENDTAEDQGVICSVRLKRRSVRKSRSIDSLGLGGVVESNVGESNSTPSEETTDGSHVGKVTCTMKGKI